MNKGKEICLWKILGILRPLILNFKTTFPIFKITKCGQDHTKIGTAGIYCSVFGLSFVAGLSFTQFGEILRNFDNDTRVRFYTQAMGCGKSRSSY